MQYELQNKNGMKARFIARGATLTHLFVPDQDGELADVVLGFDSIEEYASNANQHFGCTTGRYANRIAKGQFSLEGKEYQLVINNGENHLHGGTKRDLSRVDWTVEQVVTEFGSAIQFQYTSPDGEEGFPGTLALTVTYSLSEENELRIEYVAETDQATPLNLTNHTYFNLAGAGSLSALDHVLMLNADCYTPTDEGLIPTGEIVPVAGTCLDFRESCTIGERIEELDNTAWAGYDHNFVLNHQDDEPLTFAAAVQEPVSGRVMMVHTTEPGIQLYSANHLKNQIGKEGKAYAPRSAFCLEAQHYPDSVHHENFPTTILNPGEVYYQATSYTFSVFNEGD